MLYDITAKDLCKYYPVYTKAGFIWKNRIDWEVIQVPGNKVKTYFGIFTFLRAYKVDKVWYWVLTDGTKTITVKRDQARRNKKLPKTATITTALMLAQPKELIDQILEQANIFVTNFKQQQLENPSNYHSKGELKRGIKIKKTWQEFKLTGDEQWLEDPVNLFGHKAHFIDICCRLGWKQSKKVYRQLLQYYHPDHNSNYPTQYLEKLNWLNH